MSEATEAACRDTDNVAMVVGIVWKEEECEGGEGRGVGCRGTCCVRSVFVCVCMCVLVHVCVCLYVCDMCMCVVKGLKR